MIGLFRKLVERLGRPVPPEMIYLAGEAPPVRKITTEAELQQIAAEPPAGIFYCGPHCPAGHEHFTYEDVKAAYQASLGEPVAFDPETPHSCVPPEEWRYFVDTLEMELARVMNPRSDGGDADTADAVVKRLWPQVEQMRLRLDIAADGAHAAPEVEF